MINNLIFKKGDILIDFGKAYKVSDIKNQLNLSGKKEQYVIYKPCFASGFNNTLICSIPISSLSDANIRKPLKKHELSGLLNFENEGFDDGIEQDGMKTDKILQSNDPIKISKLLKKLWVSKTDIKNKPNRTCQKICNEAIAMLSQEIAIVYNITEEQAEEKLLSRLK